MDALAEFKARQKTDWAAFAPMQAVTIGPAQRLVTHARIAAGMRVLDVACGTGVVALTAARIGAHVTGLDLTPQLLEAAQENARVAGIEIDFHEGDVESLPFPDESFDCVVSQYGHMFAPRPAVAVGEMLRVLKRGGTIAFSTWPPELLVGRLFALVGRYQPNRPPPGVEPVWLWGEPSVVRERLGDAVHDVVFDRATWCVAALSPAHHRLAIERTAGPITKLVAYLAAHDEAKLEAFRREYDAITSDYFADNLVRQGYLLTRAIRT
jgi:SAM-dependent methyltransferase